MWFCLLSKLLVEVFGELVKELEGVEVVGPGDLVHAALDADCEVLGHEAGLDGLDAGGLEVVGELGQGVVRVELGPEEKEIKIVLTNIWCVSNT